MWWNPKRQKNFFLVENKRKKLIIEELSLLKNFYKILDIYEKFDALINKKDNK